jgi:hypothetical protein
MERSIIPRGELASGLRKLKRIRAIKRRILDRKYRFYPRVPDQVSLKYQRWVLNADNI